ncbi:hypothetical protein [Clostridium ljungdahlii]|uniref:Bacteriophage T4 Gp32 single-stranded DNA-binding domain-containing protein n=1 Tax=Clostridium ljungdahlii TaxID=1538 RepID=A0A166RL23_9CLOT|nr:hypothetical protein [Clostridium ljungdahlii]OAA90888.1 hypothetical protein WY13_00954 [Clostridium ljungdahlii]
MSLVSGRGSQIRFGGDVDLKTVFIRLKQNESVKVRVLSVNDYVEYLSHGSYAHKIYTQPCVAPNGVECPLCIAAKSGVEGFDALYVKKRYLFAFADLEMGSIRVWECSYNQAKDLLSQIKEYEDDINEVAFNFKRTGTGTETSYKLNPILKMKGDLKDKFDKFEGGEVELSFFDDVLVPRSENMMLDVLSEAGFPMSEFFPNYLSKEVREVNNAANDEEEPAF